MLVQPLLLSHLPDVDARDALIISVIPLANVLGDLNPRVASLDGDILCKLSMGLPGQIFQTEVQQLEGALSSFPGRDESVFIKLCEQKIE